MIDLIIKNAQVATASDLFNCDIGIDKEKIIFLEKIQRRKQKITLMRKTNMFCLVE